MNFSEKIKKRERTNHAFVAINPFPLILTRLVVRLLDFDYLTAYLPLT